MFEPTHKRRSMSEIASGPRRARRAQPRARVVLTAQVRSPSGCFDGTVLDIGIGGLFIEADVVPEYGQQVELEVALDPSHGPFRMSAVVRWTKQRGFGVQLLELDARTTHAIAGLVHAARVSEGG